MDEIHSHMILIARKVLRQGGTILIDLGCDEKGDCSNFVEVEQIILVQNYLFSFSQVFASIPISWSDNQRFSFSIIHPFLMIFNINNFFF